MAEVTHSIIRTDFDTTTNKDLLNVGLRKLFSNSLKNTTVEYPIVTNDLKMPINIPQPFVPGLVGLARFGFKPDRIHQNG